MRLFVPLLALFTGCVEYEFTQFDGTDVFYQKPADLVDILLVVDNSCSMDPYQEKLSQNFQSFIQFFVDVDIDYHIGVVTTTVTEPYENIYCNSNDISRVPEPGHLVNGLVIDSETENPEQKFSNAVNVGICGSGSEMGLEAAALALSPELLGGVNSGFIREDAELSIIFVSDEEDASPAPVNDYLNIYRAVKGERNRGSFDASALVVTDKSECSRDQINAGATVGSRYMDVALQGDGVQGNICSADFATVVTDLSLNASRLEDTFYLSDMPDPTTLSVSVNATDYPCEDGAWTYTILVDEYGDELPVVIFDRTNLPPPSSQIAIRYYDGDGDESLFCQGVE